METFSETIVKIIDMKGRILHSQIMQKTKGIAEINLSASDLNVGSYICRIIQGNKESNIQFIKS